MATINQNLQQTAEALEKANAKVLEAQRKIDAAKQKKEDILIKKQEAELKLKKAREKVKGLKGKKIKMNKKIDLKQGAKGLSKIVLSMVKKSLKALFKSKIAIELLKQAFLKKCPFKDKLKEIIKKKNKISNVINQIQDKLTTLETTTQTLSTIILLISGIVTLVKVLVASVGSIPPPATAPSGPLIIADDGKDVAVTKIERFEKISQQALVAISMVSFSLTEIKIILGEIDAFISLCLIEAVENGEMSEEELGEMMIELNKESTNWGDGDEDLNNEAGEKLLASLQPGALNPLGYRGFRLEEQPNPKDTTSFTSRRVVGYEMETNILTIATEYSFTTNSETLVDECKILIDRYLLKISPQPIDIIIEEEEEPIEELIIEEPIILEPYSEYKKGEYWKYADHPTIYYDRPEGYEEEGYELTVYFSGDMDYVMHRMEHGFPYMGNLKYSEISERPGMDPSYTGPTGYEPYLDDKISQYYTVQTRGTRMSDIAAQYGTC